MKLLLLFFALILITLIAADNHNLSAYPCYYKRDQKWIISPDGTIISKAKPNLCWNIDTNSNYLDGVLLNLGPCVRGMTPTWTFIDGSIRCTDNCMGYTDAALTLLNDDYAQLYLAPFRDDLTQQWEQPGAKNAIKSKSKLPLCVGQMELTGESNFCPEYHTVTGPDYYDPSGPIQTPDGVWHVWQDKGNWLHYTSNDLLNWTMQDTANFTAFTGSIGITKAGIFAFYPLNDQSAIASSVATDPYTMGFWFSRGNLIPRPLFTGTDFRDPMRPFMYQGTYYMGIGCNNNYTSGDLCLYAASDETLGQWQYLQRMFSVKSTYGQLSPENIWVNISASVNMMECPDLFPLGNKWMLVASLFVTNQWWIGHLVGNPPIFVPENTGLVDYGNYYAAKTGTDVNNGPSSRRIIFSFDGWAQPTADPQCGHSMTLPREITLGRDQISPRINPLPEVRDLQIASSHQTHSGAFTSVNFPPGSHIQINAVCSITGTISAGRFIMRVLGSTDGSHFTDIGFDFYEWALFVNVHKCCRVPNFYEQQAPLQGNLEPANTLNMTVFIDGQIIETFVNGLVTLTTLVSPDIGDGLPRERTNTIINAAGDGLQCTLDFWSMVNMVDN